MGIVVKKRAVTAWAVAAALAGCAGWSDGAAAAVEGAVGKAMAAAEQGYPAKPAKTVLDWRHRTDLISVKFRDDLAIRARGGELDDAGTGALDAAKGVLVALAGGRWEPQHDIAEAELDRFRRTAEANLGVPMPNLATYVRLHLPEGADAAGAIDLLNTLDIVEMAEGWPHPVELPMVPDLTPNQTYVTAAPAGIDALGVRGWPGGRGAGVRIADLEYAWNLSHIDLPPITYIFPIGGNPYGNDHGTAVMGQIVGKDDGQGVTGAAPDAIPFVTPTFVANVWDVGAAITRTMTRLSAGDVILLEQQMAGPRADPNSQFGLIPVEWRRSWYDAIRTAVGNGIVVVAAAGNGSQNLDDAIYSTGNSGHWPFLPANDSGSIIVGAGGAPGTSSHLRRLSFSNYGSRLSLHADGHLVWTTGYGDQYWGGGTNAYFTATFSGTSSASPIVSSAALLLQSLNREATGGVLPPLQVREVLRQTGTPQLPTSGGIQNIGPRPNVVAAAWSLFPADCDSDGVPDALQAWSRADVTGSGTVDTADITAFLSLWFAARGGLPGASAADFNRDGQVTTVDVTAFLEAWFTARSIGGC